jgi:hypothetical protein
MLGRDDSPSGYSIAGPLLSPSFRTTTITWATKAPGDGLCAGHPAGRVCAFVGIATYSKLWPSHSNGVQSSGAIDVATR